ncbi:MAG: BMP family ABC transporter substrate-binding protein [Actinomycetales bacterium]|nr:BMP family ABC transporter substrate-binding protein [Actinomycetales bacterium]
MKKGLKLASILVATLLILAGCAKKDSAQAACAPSETGSSSFKVGLAYDTGGKGDGSFNDSACAGLAKAQADLGVGVKELTAGADETDATRIARLRQLASNGYNPVIAVGFAYSAALDTVAKEFPNVSFAIVDSVVEGKNIGSLVFAAEQGSYLVGVIAAKASKNGHIGFVGGQEVPLIKAFEAGYIQGAKSVNPDVMVESKYLGTAQDFTAWNVPEKAKTVTEGMISKGVDVTYAAAGGSGLGMIQAMHAAGADHWAIGVDSDQYNVPAYSEYKDSILTSMTKRVDVSVYDVIKGVIDGKPLVGLQNFDLARNGVGYATSNSAVDAYKADADNAAAGILDGSIKVNSK